MTFLLMSGGDEMQGQGKPDYQRISDDGQYAAWYSESWYYGHHYRVYSSSPWHTCGNGTRYATEWEAKQAVDTFLDEWVPLAKQERKEKSPFTQ
jgi:hypothetical protein